MKFFFFIFLAMLVSVEALAKAAGRDLKHYENSISTDLGNDFGQIFLRWKKASENSMPLEGNSFDSPSVGMTCPLLVGPKSMLFWTRKEKTNAMQETQAGGDYRQAA